MPGKAMYSTNGNQGCFRTVGTNTTVSVWNFSGLLPAGEGHVDHLYNPFPQARRDPEGHTSRELDFLVIPEVDHNSFIF